MFNNLMGVKCPYRCPRQRKVSEVFMALGAGEFYLLAAIGAAFVSGDLLPRLWSLCSISQPFLDWCQDSGKPHVSALWKQT